MSEKSNLTERGKPGAAPITHGVGRTGLAPIVYATLIRMLAEGHKVDRTVKYICQRWPHHREGDDALTYDRVYAIKKRRAKEISELRAKLMANLDDLWMAQPRMRITALQRIFEDANRWVPKRVLALQMTPEQEAARSADPNERQLSPRELELRGAPTQLIVYEKDTGSMLSALKSAREEVGVDPTSRVADSIENLVQRMEGERGLDPTIVDVEATVENAVPTLIEGEMVETPDFYPSAGSDANLGLLDGESVPGEAMPDGVRGSDD